MHDSRLRAAIAGGIAPRRDMLAELLRRTTRAELSVGDGGPVRQAATLVCLAEGVTNHVLLGTLTPEEGRRLVDTHLAGLFGTPVPRPPR